MTYKKAYGTWVGNPAGFKPDLKRCCEAIWNHPFSHGSQCRRPRGYGPDKAYCKIHDPEAVKKKLAAREARWKEKFNKERYSFHGRTFFEALFQIAEGHNDARGLAKKVIDKFNEGEEK